MWDYGLIPIFVLFTHSSGCYASFHKFLHYNIYVILSFHSHKNDPQIMIYITNSHLAVYLLTIYIV